MKCRQLGWYLVAGLHLNKQESFALSWSLKTTTSWGGLSNGWLGTGEKRGDSETSSGFSQRSLLLKQTQLELSCVYCQIAKAKEEGVLNANEGWGSETTVATQPARYTLGKSFFSSVSTGACRSTKHRMGKWSLRRAWWVMMLRTSINILWCRTWGNIPPCEDHNDWNKEFIFTNVIIKMAYK